jgi:acetate kinase
MAKSDQSILCLNSGSSTIKYAVFDLTLAQRTRGMVEVNETTNHMQALQQILTAPEVGSCGTPRIVGHRVVHGGALFDHPALIDPTILNGIKSLTKLAPGHQPHNIAGIEAVKTLWPATPQIACFDTAFHASLPAHRSRLPVAQRFADKGLRRYGFHGLSYTSICQQLPEVLGKRAQGKVVMCHLGNGCSLAAIENLRCVHTSMGFTPLDGLMMGQRPGRLDPGAVIWLAEELGGDLIALRKTLNSDSGLLGVSGESSDMRILLASKRAQSKLAVTMFVDRLAQEIAAAAAALGGIDAITFSGGIGENAIEIQDRTKKQLNWLPVDVTYHVIATNEERVIARAALDHISK